MGHIMLFDCTFRIDILKVYYFSIMIETETKKNTFPFAMYTHF